jgi:chaperonin GroEL
MNLNQHLISKTPEADQYDSCLLKNSKFNSVKNNNDNETSSSKKIYCTCNNHEIFVNERVRQKIINESFNIGYDAAEDTFGDMYSFGIIDPCKVSRSAVQNATSIAAMILTTECIVVNS